MHPTLQLPAFTRFVDGTGPIFAGKVFPFVFITIACGAVSGFHALISSGTTPKMIAREWNAWPVGYGSMLLEGFVAIMALIAACSLQPGVFFAVNSPPGVVGASPAAAVATISSWGYPVSVADMNALAADAGEKTLFYRTGGAPSLALGMAHIFSSSGGGRGVLGFWYHFAIMFEALFILTIIAAGTRVGRFMLQDLLGHAYPSLKRSTWMPGVFATSGVVVAGVGIFSVSRRARSAGRHQFAVAAVWDRQSIAGGYRAVRGHHDLRQDASRALYVDHGAPLLWLVVVTFTAGYQKIFSDQPRVGFLAEASHLQSAMAAGRSPRGRSARRRRTNFQRSAGCGGVRDVSDHGGADFGGLDARLVSGYSAALRKLSVDEAPFVLSQLQVEEL